MAFSVSNASAALKTLYPQKKMLQLMIEASASPFLAKVHKTTNFGGNNMVVPVVYANTKGSAATFSVAQALKGGSSLEDFVVTRAKYYSLFSLENELVEASKGNEGAFVDMLKHEVGSASNAHGRAIGIQLFGDGVGNLGVISAIGSDIITLTNIRDISRFEYGQSIVFAASSTASLRDSGTAATITDIDRTLGKITISATPTGVVANDLIWRKGDYVSSSDRLVMKGLAAWLPTSVTATTFFGVDRTNDAERLAGHRVDASAFGSLKEALMRAAVIVAENGGRPDHIFCSFKAYEDLVNDLGSKAQYTDFKVGEIGFSGLRLLGPAGPIDVFPDPNCSQGSAFVLQMKAIGGVQPWELATLGPCPHMLTYGGRDDVLREASDDAVEGRLGSYGNLVCRAPAFNAHVYSIS